MTKKNIWRRLSDWMPNTTFGLLDLMHALISVFELANPNLLKRMPNGEGRKKIDLFLFSVSEFCFICRLLSIITFMLRVFVSFSTPPAPHGQGWQQNCLKLTTLCSVKQFDLSSWRSKSLSETWCYCGVKTSVWLGKTVPVPSRKLK